MTSTSGLKLPTSNEAEVRALAAAKTQAKKAYEAARDQDTRNFTDDQMVTYEVETARLFKAYFAASAALQGAV